MGRAACSHPMLAQTELSGAQEHSHRLPKSRPSCFAPPRGTAPYAQRLVQRPLC
jgi:hypothetical protein